MIKNSPAVYYTLYRCGLVRARSETTLDEQGCISKFATGRKSLVEIGVWHGVNTLNMRRHMNCDGTLFAVDPFPPGRVGLQWEKLVAHHEVDRSNNGNVIWLESKSGSAVNEIHQYHQDGIDFLFIDGDHSYTGVQLDWRLWSPLVTVGGVVLLHDSRSYPGRNIDNFGVVRFRLEEIHCNPQFQLIAEVDSLTVYKKLY